MNGRECSGVRRGNAAMRKAITVILLLLASSASYGAVSEDVYVRRDVYGVQMSVINEKLDMILEQMKEFQEELQEQRKDIAVQTRVIAVMSERIDRNFDTLSARIDGLDKRMDNQQNYLYLVLVILGIIVALPTVQKLLQSLADRKPTITLEDVRRLIEESKAQA